MPGEARSITAVDRRLDLRVGVLEAEHDLVAVRLDRVQRELDGVALRLGQLGQWRDPADRLVAWR